MTQRPDNGAVPSWLAPLAAAAGQMQVAAALRPPETGGRPAAVLILLGDGGQSGPDLLLVQRSATLREHAGQPAFPGGTIDPGDGSPVGAALREAAEETGIDPASVHVVAVMPEVFLWRTGYRVTPVVGWWHSPGPVAPGDLAEIESVRRIPVTELADPANRLTLRYPDGRAGPAFLAGGLLVWVFTALLLDQVLALGGWERPWDSARVADLPASAVPTRAAATPGAPEERGTSADSPPGPHGR